MYYLKSDKADYGINLLTSIDELTPELLNELTKEITLSKHYAIVCIAYRTSLFDMSSTIGGGKRPEMINVIPLIAKVNTDDTNSPVKGETMIGQSPIIAPTALERGYQVYIPSVATANQVFKYIANDNDLRTKLFQKKYDGNVKYLGLYNAQPEMIIEDNKTKVIILDFKIVPMTDIVGYSPVNYTIEDFALIKDNKLNKE